VNVHYIQAIEQLVFQTYIPGLRYRHPSGRRRAGRIGDGRPAPAVERARNGVHCIGLSILSGSHLAMTHEVLALMRAAGLAHAPVVVGGVIPPDDAERLRAAGVAAVYAPEDFAINRIIGDIVGHVEGAFESRSRSAGGGSV
jgi:hypothetical protein